MRREDWTSIFDRKKRSISPTGARPHAHHHNCEEKTVEHRRGGED
jgi:hypothetical protein